MRRPRLLLGWIALVLAVGPLFGAGTLTVILLGTGGPELTPHRQGAATLVIAGDQYLLFDAGRGVLQRLYESQVKIPRVTRVFFTHLHSDHIEGLPSLWMTSWFLLGRMTPMEFHGPQGTAAMVKGMELFLGHDLVHRVHGADQPEGLKYTVTEFAAAGGAYEQGGVKVTAFAVDHKDGNPALGYRVDYAGRSVVLSGDCTYSAGVVEHGRGADLLVHNVFAVSAPVMASDPVKKIVAEKLASPEQVAAVLAAAKPRLGALSHVIRVDLTDADVVARIRAAAYAGPLTVGQDRMVIEIGDEVVVKPPALLENLPDAAKRGDL